MVRSTLTTTGDTEFLPPTSLSHHSLSPVDWLLVEPTLDETLPSTLVVTKPTGLEDTNKIYTEHQIILVHIDNRLNYYRRRRVQLGPAGQPMDVELVGCIKPAISVRNPDCTALQPYQHHRQHQSPFLSFFLSPLLFFFGFIWLISSNRHRLDSNRITPWQASFEVSMTGYCACSGKCHCSLSVCQLNYTAVSQISQTFESRWILSRVCPPKGPIFSATEAEPRTQYDRQTEPEIQSIDQPG